MNSFKRVDAAHIPNKTKHLLDAQSRTVAEPGLKDSFIVSVVSLAPSKRVQPSMRERAALLAVALGGHRCPNYRLFLNRQRVWRKTDKSSSK
jgi:hypothetical protein